MTSIRTRKPRDPGSLFKPVPRVPKKISKLPEEAMPPQPVRTVVRGRTVPAAPPAPASPPGAGAAGPAGAAAAGAGLGAAASAAGAMALFGARKLAGASPRKIPGPPPITFTTGGVTPDYAGLIQADPIYSQTQANLSAQGIADNAQAKAAAARALIGFGAVPEGLDPTLARLVDPTTAKLAADNTAEGLSTVAQLDRAHQRNLRAGTENLAASGTLESGATGVMLGQELQDYKANQVAARQQLIDTLASLNSSLASNEAGRQQQLAQAAQDAAGRVQQLYPAWPGAQVSGTWDPHAKAFVGSDGNYYDQNHQPLDPHRVHQNLADVVRQLRAQHKPWSQIKRQPFWSTFENLDNQLKGTWSPQA